LVNVEISAYEVKMSGVQEAIRVLVVDDSVDAANGLAAILSSADYEARAAYDGPTALETATTFKPHVVMLDIDMPQMNGYTTALGLRQLAPAEKQILIAYTAHSGPESVAAAARAGFDLHLSKPCEARQLLQLLEQTVLNLVHGAPSDLRRRVRHANG
jgi:CheY-like chemotaxis protein